MVHRPHYWLDLIILALAWLAAFGLARRLQQPNRRLKLASIAALALLSGFGASLAASRVARQFAPAFVAWVRCFALFASVGLIYTLILVTAARLLPFQRTRRNWLRAAGTAAVAAPVVATTFGILRRDDLQPREVRVPLPAFAAGLDGLRIVQVTDIHLSPFVARSYLARAIGMANEFRPHLALVTGDLITVKGDPLDDCISELAGLRAEAGVYGCCGNHEIYAEAEEYVQKQSALLGMKYLRNESVTLRFGGSSMQLAGVDYQRRGERYLPGTEHLQEAGYYNVLLSHNPDVFPVAAKQGWDLTIGGHTHGGQIQMEFLHPSLNVARFYTPFTYGLYEQNGKRLYVSRGVGTIGVPLRLGAPPEVVCLRLCAT